MFLLLLLAILGLGEAGNARVAIGTMAGTVVDSHGKPVAGATVTIQTSEGVRPFATHTDASGHFEFTRFETGQYDLRAYSNGVFSDWQKRIMIHTKKPTKITLRIPDPK